MSNRNKNNRNRWDDDRNYNDYRNNEGNRNWERDSRGNTSMHQGSWNNGGGSHDENFGLGDTSQGSANYGHEDHNQGARYYGTGNYGGYFGGGSDDDKNESSRYEDRRGQEARGDNRNERRSDDVLSNNTGNYERGPRVGNSNIHGRTYGNNRNYYRSNEGNRDRNSRYGNERGAADWDSDRDWWDKTSDEVSSWFGDEEAGRRRDMDEKYGPHAGKGPKGYTRSNEKIKEDIQEKLYHDTFIDASDIDVSVSDGDVTLSGTVDNRQTKRRAEDCADRVTGVKDVSNQLKINRSTSSYNTSEIGSLNKEKTTGSLSEKDQKLDQSKDLNRTENK
ncbi:MAG: BON domain-containing protein [Ginsengibacter sp.]